MDNGKYIYDNNLFNDITFDWEDVKIGANKGILCLKSKHFMKIFMNNLLEAKTGVVKMYDYQIINGKRIKTVTIESYDFQLFLNYVYTKTIPGDFDNFDFDDLNRLLDILDIYGEDDIRADIGQYFDRYILDQLDELSTINTNGVKLRERPFNKNLSIFNSLSKRLFEHPLPFDILINEYIVFNHLSDEEIIEIINYGKSIVLTSRGILRIDKYENLWSKVKNRPNIHPYLHYYAMNDHTLRLIPRDVIIKNAQIDGKQLFSAPVKELICKNIPFVGVIRRSINSSIHCLPSIYPFITKSETKSETTVNMVKVHVNDYFQTLPSDVAIMFTDFRWDADNQTVIINKAIVSEVEVPYVLTDVKNINGELKGKYYVPKNQYTPKKFNNVKPYDFKDDLKDKDIIYYNGQYWINPISNRLVIYTNLQYKYLNTPLLDKPIYILTIKDDIVIDWLYLV